MSSQPHNDVLLLIKITKENEYLIYMCTGVNGFTLKMVLVLFSKYK